MTKFAIDYKALSAATASKSPPFNPVRFIIEERDKGRVFTKAGVISICSRPTCGPSDYDNWKRAFEKEIRRQKMKWLFSFFTSKGAT